MLALQEPTKEAQSSLSSHDSAAPSQRVLAEYVGW